jgi:molecular chaperone Hsp33
VPPRTFTSDSSIAPGGTSPTTVAVARKLSSGCTSATATVVGEVPPGAMLESLVNVRGGGRCAITLDPRDRQPGQQPYQGVVPLHGDQREPLQQVQQVLEHYMLQSEQLDTRLVLAADQGIAAGLLIQRLPVEGEGNLGRKNEDDIGVQEDFNRIALLAATLTREELLTLDSATILRRLFWQEKLRVFEPAQPRFACSCSRERVRNMLLGLGREESESLIAERGRFDAVDVGEMFTPGRDQPPLTAAVQ